MKKKRILSWIEFFTAKDLDNNEKSKLKEVNKIMKKVIDRYERFTSSEDEMQVYNARDAFLYGQTVMLKKEREEGIKEGIKKGMEEGVEKGKKSEKIAIDKNLKNSGIDINIISENTGLSIEEIKNL